ncbi:MAG TPA: CDP-diacylglycerol--glycerol-3-phosphate 3-phosphatidyltransferase [Caulobacter sp.]|nr:CDP-diacylglycerol--glycerol-3-phosphate 3-phosphatidyltransferase [Caulobacter sp.]
MKHIPNLITLARLVLTLAVFVALLGGALGWCDDGGPPLYVLAFWGFVIAAVTDFLDGWLARKYQVESLMGAILDPIADKVLVAGAVVGLAASGDTTAALAGGLILFREFSVSALREVLAPRGLRLPVTVLAKWKTTLQLVALAAAILRLTLPAWLTPPVSTGIDIVLWLAAVVTVWTGIEYGLAARKALKET